MSENTLPTALPTRQAAAIEGRSRRGAVTGKPRWISWCGTISSARTQLPKAGLADASLRFAFRKPHVMTYFPGKSQVTHCQRWRFEMVLRRMKIDGGARLPFREQGRSGLSPRRLFEKRRKLMEAWATYCAAPKVGKVATFAR